MTRGAKTTLSVGHVTHDRFASGVRAGGSAFFGARAFRALGARSRLVACVGEDFERFEELRDLDVFLRVGGATTAFTNTYDAKGARAQRIAAVGAPVTPEALPSGWRRSDALFLAPVIGEVDPAAWLDAVSAPVVGLGLQGLMKRPASSARRARPLVADAVRLDARILERLDAVFLSREDLAAYGSAALLDALRRSVRIVVLTCGSRGSRIWSGGREHHVGTFPARAKDPTGAGDVFAAAFLFALSEGAEPMDAARLGSAAASIAVESVGASSIVRLHESRRRAARVPATTLPPSTRKVFVVKPRRASLPTT